MLEKFEGMAISWDFGNRCDNNCIMLLNAGRGTAEIARTIFTKDEEGTHVVKGYAVVEIAKVRELERKKNEVEQELYVLKDEIAVLEKALKLCVKEYLYWFYENDTTTFDTEELVAKYKDEEYLRFISQAEKELEGENNDQ